MNNDNCRSQGIQTKPINNSLFIDTQINTTVIRELLKNTNGI